MQAILTLYKRATNGQKKKTTWKALSSSGRWKLKPQCSITRILQMAEIKKTDNINCLRDWRTSEPSLLVNVSHGPSTLEKCLVAFYKNMYVQS